MTSVITTPTWIVNERPRVALLLIILGFLTVYTPAYTLFFKNFALTPADLAVLQAISQVQGAFDAMIPDRYKDDLWVLNRCYVAMTPTYFGMVLSAALIYESSLFFALVWNFLRRDSTAHSTGILLAGCSTASAYSLLSYQPSSRASAVP
ncbi:hypothetical protein FRB95_008353 [Tulasnella sp. JGI-2019a]|nr:hypothetical protein FRB93_007638 [Tulasnella sp. JGI-2019a]KAG9026867.1 hypothetical protein FRB95_008353 [Tulasnella sp. JGI-2019a]